MRTQSRRWVGRLARFGLACRGLLYLVIALLAIDLARGRGGRPDQRGALETLAHHPFGHALVLAIAVGFAGLAVWQAAWATWPPRVSSTTARRLVAAGKAVIYLALCASAIAVAFGGRSGSSGDQQVVDVTGRAMHGTAGRALVGTAGLIICIAGVVLIVKALRRGYDNEVRISDVPRPARHAFEAVGVAGMGARGIVVGLIGYFVVQAAITYDPGHAKGLDGVLSTVVHHPYGPWLLGLIAIGLGCFGLFSLLEVRYARTGI